MKAGEQTKTKTKKAKKTAGQVGFYFDQTRCDQCFACVVACKDWHDVPAGPANWLAVTVREEGKFPDVFVSFLFRPCWHCADPICGKACPVSAITKRAEDGIVVVDRDVCIGGDECGRACLKACPYDAPQFGAEDNPKMQKCDFCLEEWEEGRLPICVRGCTMRALDAGPLDELRKKYGDVRTAHGFKYDKKREPAVIFKPKVKKG